MRGCSPWSCRCVCRFRGQHPRPLVRGVDRGRLPCRSALVDKERKPWITKKDFVLDAVRLRPTQLNVTARRRYLPVRRVAIRRLPCGAACAVSGSAEPCTPAGIFGKTRNPAGTWAAACPWRRRLARGCLHPVPSDGAANGRRATAGLQIGIQPTRVTCRVQRHGPFSGAPRRPVAASSRTRVGAAKRPCRRPADNGLGAATQRPWQGGGVQPPRLAPTARQRRQYKRSGY